MLPLNNLFNPTMEILRSKMLTQELIIGKYEDVEKKIAVELGNW